MYLLEILVFLIILFFSLFAYIKIKYPFWNIQPVFHKYDFWRSFYNTPFIIYKHCPIKTKFCDFENTKTTNYLECSPEQQKILIDLIQCYYIPSDRVTHNIDLKKIDTLFIGNREPGFVSIYYENTYDISQNTIIETKTPKGCISSRSMQFFFRESFDSVVYKELTIYFIDYLCVRRDHNTTKINRILLQTHEYNQRIQNPSVSISLLKKEVELFDGVVPFILYSTSSYVLRKINYPSLPAHFFIKRINKTNIDLLVDFIHIQTHYYYQKENPCLFDACIITEMGSITERIIQGSLYAYCLQRGKNIYGYYFFKDSFTEYEDIRNKSGDSGGCLHMIASVMNIKSGELFYQGFIHSLYDILKINKNYKMLLFDKISHNVLLLSYWNRRFSTVFTNPSAYYLYNMVFPKGLFNAERTFVLI